MLGQAYPKDILPQVPYADIIIFCHTVGTGTSAEEVGVFPKQCPRWVLFLFFSFQQCCGQPFVLCAGPLGASAEVWNF